MEGRFLGPIPDNMEDKSEKKGVWGGWLDYDGKDDQV